MNLSQNEKHYLTRIARNMWPEFTNVTGARYDKAKQMVTIYNHNGTPYWIGLQPLGTAPTPHTC